MNTEHAPNDNFSDDSETKKHVTPFAFGVAEELLGKPLASPRRRLVAVMIDLIFIALLTTLNTLVLAILVMFISARGLYSLRGQVAKGWQKLLLGFALFVSSVIILIYIAAKVFDFNSVVIDDKEISTSNEQAETVLLEYKNSEIDDEFSLVISELKNKDDEPLCEPGDKCDVPFFNALIQHLIEQGYEYQDASTLFIGVREFLNQNQHLDSDFEQLTLSERLYNQRYKREHAFFSAEEEGVSIISLLQGFIRDLGLSFGWAAMYFSVLTAWCNGQTLGKKILGIRVVRIDAKRIDLWESFGRYGGYSAGVATGLLGFLQIYWDANRQAIQDKISETLVIRISK